MLTKTRQSWEISENSITPENIYLDRRNITKSILLGSIGLTNLTSLMAGKAFASGANPEIQSFINSFIRNPKYILDRQITPEKYSTTYNNYYEFGSNKNIWRRAQKLKTRPWTIQIDGMVENEFSINIEDLFKKVDFEERLYRHRCVEAWSMAVPWIGFPMQQLIKLAKPTFDAKYVVMETILADRSIMPGLRQSWYPWPYTESITLEEAQNELSFLVTGMYGKELPTQNGAPLRLAIPWKYGFKSIKSIVRFTFTKERKKSFWESLAPNEYGFWANVNPDVSHPRWSQKTEWKIGGGKYDRVPTMLFNGYGEYVSHLYANIKDESLYW